MTRPERDGCPSTYMYNFAPFTPYKKRNLPLACPNVGQLLARIACSKVAYLPRTSSGVMMRGRGMIFKIALSNESIAAGVKSIGRTKCSRLMVPYLGSIIITMGMCFG